MEIKCFAQRKDGRCGALTVSRCCPETCPFYRTLEDNSASQAVALSRLAAMEDVDLVYVAEKYYEGKMPWNEGASQCL